MTVTKPLLNKALTVGALAAVAIGAFLVAFTFFKKGGYSEADTYTAFASFSDATGLTWKSRVQIAGIQIGEVSRIDLVGDKARLELRVKKGIDLHDDACLTKTYPSALLPDALLEVSPGTTGHPLLKDPGGTEARAAKVTYDLANDEVWMEDAQITVPGAELDAGLPSLKGRQAAPPAGGQPADARPADGKPGGAP